MSTSPKHSPWYMIWLHPRQAMREILHNYKTRYIHSLAIVGAFTHVVTYTYFQYNWWLTLVLWLCLSIFAGLFFLYIFGGILKWTGGWLKGQASHEEVRAAIAWSQVPVIAFFVISMILLIIFGGNAANYVYASVLLALSIWAFIIFLCCLAEAQKFSFVRALINYLLGGAIILGVMVILMMIVNYFAGPNMAQTTAQKLAILVLNLF